MSIADDPFLAEAEAVLVQSWRNDRASVTARVNAAVRYIDLKGSPKVLPDVEKLTEAEAEQFLYALIDKYLAQGRFPHGFVETMQHWIEAHPETYDPIDDDQPPNDVAPRTRRDRIRNRPRLDSGTPTEDGEKYIKTPNGFAIRFPNGESAEFHM